MRSALNAMARITESDSLIGSDCGDYTIHQFVGKGTFGKVYRGTCTSAKERGGATFIVSILIHRRGIHF